MTTSKTAQQAIADLSETLEYSIECGYVQHAAVRWLRDRHVAARAANAAERAALTEQVAQLTAERDAKQEDRDYWHDSSIAEGKAKLKLRGELMGQERATQQLSAEVARLTEALAAAERDAARNKSWEPLHDAEQERAESAEREVARLTEALAAAEQETDHAIRKYRKAFDRAEAAERDRDAARALLRQWRGLYAGRLLPEVLARQTDAHLSSQPAAPACACGHPEESGKHGAGMCEIDEDDQLETAPTPREAHSCDWFGRFTCRICGKHRDEPAAAYGTADESPGFNAAAPAPTAAEARVRELETHNASLRERNTELVHLKQVAEARVRELEVFKEAHSEARRGYAERVAGLEDELAALRERVASAVETLQRALEALRGN